MDGSRQRFSEKPAHWEVLLSLFLGLIWRQHMRSFASSRLRARTETRSTCPYCSVSCGVIIYTIGDKAKNVTPQVIHVEGDPDHPSTAERCARRELHWNRTSLTRGGSLSRRCAAGLDHWEDIAWDQAISEIGHWVKKTRDETFVERDALGRTVNRCESIAWIGAAPIPTNSITW